MPGIKAMTKTESYPEGHFVGLWMGIGIAAFSGLGVPLSIATGNFGLIGIGPALGVALGLAVGQSIENTYRKAGKIRPPSGEEKRRRTRLAISGAIVATLGVLVFLLMVLT